MRCANCGSENPTDSTFCEQCGRKLELLCPACKAPVGAGARFCRKCGTNLSATSSGSGAIAGTARSRATIRVSAGEATTDVADGERKTVTALFADIKGSMELMEDLDPEQARAIIDPALRLMIDAVHRYDGYIVQSTGDGIFALFGAPVAHEDHPQRALYAALRMHEEIRHYGDCMRAQGQMPLQVRVGVNTGEVVVRSLQTGPGQAEYTPIGHSTSLAARLQALATPSSTVISGSTRRMIEGYFQIKELGKTSIKGASEPVELFEVIGLGPLRTRLQAAARRGLTKFIGRDAEMVQMRHALELTRDGHGQVVAAMGEAGVGKSRLFFEFKAVAEGGCLVLEAYSVSHGKASAYLPVTELLREYFEITGDDDDRKRRERTLGKVLGLDRRLEDTLPYLYSLFGILEAGDSLAQMDPQIRGRRTQEAIKRILLRESLNQPLIIVFEDLHWIDGETQALLNLLVDAIANARILLLVNYRPEYRHEWGSRTHYTQLRLDPLGPESAEEMLAILLGDTKDLTPLKRLIIERTEGNPFFMEETVQALLEEGALVHNGDVKLIKPLSGLRIPLTVQAVLSARIDRLPPAEKELLQTLAVIGKDLPLELVKRVTGTNEAQLAPILTDLQAGEFIYEQPSIAGPEYTFKHALTLEVAYNSLLTERRRIIHERTARSIEDLYPQELEDHWSELTRHYLRGIDAAKAVQYARLAAEQAVGRSAYPEAASITEAAVKVLDKILDSTERIRAELALRTVESVSAAVRFGASSQERERVALRMCELGEMLGEGEELLRGVQALAFIYGNRGEPLKGLEPGRRCLQLAEATQDGGLIASAHYVLGCLGFSCGNLQDAVSHLQQARDQLERSDRNLFFGQFLAKNALKCILALVMQLLGQVGEASKLAEAGLRDARESGHLLTLGCALSFGGQICCIRREPKTALLYVQEGLALSQENGFKDWLNWARVHHGWALAELGQLEQGVAEMMDGIAALQGGAWHAQHLSALLAQSYARMGRPDKALTILNQALRLTEHTGELIAHAEFLRLKGEVAVMQNAAATTEAEHCFRLALDVARAQEAKWWELRTSVSLARLLRDTSRCDEARTMLGEIYDWFTEGFDTADLKDAKALLDELSA